MDYIKKEDKYYKVVKEEVEDSIFVRDENDEVTEVTGFKIKETELEVTIDEINSEYVSLVEEYNNITESIKEAEEEMSKLENKQKEIEEEMRCYEIVLPEELIAKEEVKEEESTGDIKEPVTN